MKSKLISFLFSQVIFQLCYDYKFCLLFRRGGTVFKVDPLKLDLELPFYDGLEKNMNPKLASGLGSLPLL